MEDRESVLKRYQEMASFEDFNIRRFDQAGADDDAPIHAAAYLGKLDDIQVMLNDGVDVNLAGDIGNTALHFAALKGHEDLIELLLRRGANPMQRNDYGDLAIDFYKGSNEHIISLLNPQEKRVR